MGTANSLAQQQFTQAQPVECDVPVLKPIGQGLDHFMNNIVIGGFDQAMTATCAYIGDKAGELGQKGTQVVADRMDNVASPVTDSKSVSPDSTPAIAKEVDTPNIAQNKEVTSQVAASGLKFPEGTSREAVHVDDHNLTAVTQSALIAPSQYQTNNQSLQIG